MNFYKAKINDFSLKTITDYNVLVPVGDQIFKNNRIIVLNETALFMWNKLETEMNTMDLVKSLVDEYEITASQVLDDVDSFINKMIEADALEVREVKIGSM